MVASCLFAALVWAEPQPAANWQESSLTGNGTIGAMMEGRIENESIHLSHCKLYLPEPGETPPVLVNHPRRNPGDYNNRDGFMAACDLKVSMRLGGISEYSRRTDFETGECIVSAKDGKGRWYERRVVALRGANVIAVKTTDESKSDAVFALAGIEPSGRMDIAAFSKGIRRMISEPDYYRCEFRNENPWNKLAGYEVLLTQRRRDAECAEAFVAIEPLLKGQESNRAAMEARLANAMAKGYDALLAESAAQQKELMDRVSFELEGPKNAAEIVRNFNSGRYNIISSVGGDHVPNLQGLWAGTWSAPWFASFTVNGNLPCAISFFCRGNTPEFNESLLRWIEVRLPEMRDAAKRHFGARGFRAAAQTTVAGVETDSNANYPHVYWHGGAAWLLSRLYDGYRHTLDIEWLKKIYPLMVEVAEYYEDVLVEMPDGTLGFNPSYSPENWPTGKRPTAVNATMDIAIAKQFLGEVIEAARLVSASGSSGVLESGREKPAAENANLSNSPTPGSESNRIKKWKAMRARLTPYQVSENGFFAEWLAPGQPDNNEHRHASHLYALYDDAPAEILTNAALVAAVGKTIDARMDFNEHRSRTMAFGYVQNGLAACKIGDAARAARCLTLLTDKNWLKGGGSCHDWKNCFNTDISGGYPYLISEMLVHSEEGVVRFLPAKPKEWKSGSIKGLLLRGGLVLERLEWQDDDFSARLRFPDGTLKRVNGKAGTQTGIFIGSGV